MKKILLSVAMLMFANQMFAQRIFGNFASEIESEVKTLFPIIIVVVFIICAFFNLPHFFGENRDVKKGISNIILYVGGVTLIGGVVTYLSSMSI
ncbi:MAG: hypothetical protein ACRCZQ_02885 [Bacteroidales bacterium]